MSNLIRVELYRLRLRRAVLLLLLLAIVVPAVIFAARMWDTRPVEDRVDIIAANQPDIELCIDKPRRYGVQRDGTEAEIQRGCEDMVVGRNSYRQPLSLASERSGGGGIGIVAVLTAIMFLVGTTFVGHDWNSGSMSNQLLFETRRGRIWAAKAIAVGLVSFTWALAVSVAYWLGVYAVMGLRDLPVAENGLLDSLAYGARGAGFATAAAIGGLALTMLFRSTVATIGVLFVVSVAGGLIIGVLGIGDRWQPPKNISAIVKNGTEYWVQVPESCYQSRQPRRIEEGSTCDETRDLGAGQGVLYYGIPLLVAGAASSISFRRRDV
jgi:ABC-type transport system involved in multi-copper enzyme maturation permease subunit